MNETEQKKSHKNVLNKEFYFFDSTFINFIYGQSEWILFFYKQYNWSFIWSFFLIFFLIINALNNKNKIFNRS